MQSVLSDWTVVLAGAWNASIFTPAWVSANVFNGANVNLEMQMGPVIPNLRYQHGRMNLVIQPDLLIGGVREATPEALSEITATLRSILDLLPHTPVAGVGINFGFREEHPDGPLIANFNIPDSQKLIELGGEVTQTSIQREVKLDGGLLRLRETIEPTGAVHFHLNFHFDVTSGQAASDLLATDGAKRGARALELLKTVYGLEPE